jgi:WD40 repeat protein
MCFTKWRIATLTLLFVGVFVVMPAATVGDLAVRPFADPNARSELVHELKELATFEGHSDVPLSLALTANGRLLASGSYDNKVIVWDVVSGRSLHVLRGHTHPITALVFSPDGKTLASGTGQYRHAEAPGEVKVWDVATGKQLALIQGHAGFVSSLAFTADGKTLASGSWDRTVKLWDVATGNEQASIPTNFVWSVAFARNGKTLAAGTGVFDRTVPGELNVWDVGTKQKIAGLKGHHGAVLAVAFAPNGRTLASGDIVGKVILWDAVTGSQLAIVQNPDNSLVRALAFTADGRMLIASVVSAPRDLENGTGRSPNVVKVWEVSPLKERATFSGRDKGFGSATAISADGCTVAWGGFNMEQGSGLVKAFELTSRLNEAKPLTKPNE